MGVDVSADTSEESLKIVNETVNKFNTELTTSINTKFKNNTNQSNIADIKIKGSIIKNVKINQSSSADVFQESVSIIRQAMDFGAANGQEAEIKKKIEEVKKSTTTFGAGISANKSKSTQEQVNTIINELSAKVDNVINTDYENAINQLNSLKLDIEDAEVDGLNIDQTNQTTSEQKQNQDVDNSQKQQVGNDQVAKDDQVIKKEENKTTGLDVGGMSKTIMIVAGVIGVCVVIAVIIAIFKSKDLAKAAVDVKQGFVPPVPVGGIIGGNTLAPQRSQLAPAPDMPTDMPSIDDKIRTIFIIVSIMLVIVILMCISMISFRIKQKMLMGFTLNKIMGIRCKKRWVEDQQARNSQ